MCKKKIIAVDYINLYTLASVVRCKPIKVIYLYDHAFLQKYYLYFLNLIVPNIYKINKSKINNKKSSSLYLKTTNKKQKIIKSNFDSSNKLKNFIFGYYYYQNIHPIVELKYMLESIEVDYIYINYRNYLRRLHVQDSFYKKIKYYFLPSFVHKKHKNFFYLYRWRYFYKKRVVINSIGLLIKTIFKYSIHLSNIERTDLISYTSNNKNKNSRADFFLKKDGFKYVTINPINLQVRDNKQNRHLYSLKFGRIYKSIFNILKNYKDVTKDENISMGLFIHILSLTKKIFFLKLLLNRTKAKVLYVSNAGCEISFLLEIIGHNSKDVVSVSSTRSLGYFPELFAVSDKRSDVFFSWGDYHRDLCLSHNADKINIISVGYLLDYSIDVMTKNTRKVIRLDKKYKIISVYDNVAAADGFLTYSEYNNFFCGLVHFMRANSNYKCIIKSKRLTSRRFLDKNISSDINDFGDRVLYLDGYSDIGPAMISDVVYGISMNTLSNMASLWGKKVFIYDENRTVNEKYLSKNVTVVNCIDDLMHKFNSTDFYDSSEECVSKIDPFCDGLAQERIAEYIEYLINFSSVEKNKRIKIANQKYSDKYGNNMVFHV